MPEDISFVPALNFIAVHVAFGTLILWSELTVLLFALISVPTIIFFYHDYKEYDKNDIRTQAENDQIAEDAEKAKKTDRFCLCRKTNKNSKKLKKEEFE